MMRIEGAVESEQRTLVKEQNSAAAREDEGFHNGKIYCANCIHCKLIPAKSDKTGQYVLRVRCAAGKWKKKLGEEKLYKYCTITRRYLDSCASYEEMGDTREFIRNLKKTLSNKDEVFTLATELD
ncbi:MAG: hypothetical protein LBF78_13670 [Treponema sp.]|jgi:hypothetical protein|nr:hypothetical protein [Treponema sp.]